MPKRKEQKFNKNNRPVRKSEFDPEREAYMSEDGGYTYCQWVEVSKGNLHQKEKKMEQIESFIAEVEALPDCITEFRTDYWGHLVEKVTVHRKGAMTFTLSFGVEIEI
jgi:hypothetical protein